VVAGAPSLQRAQLEARVQLAQLFFVGRARRQLLDRHRQLEIGADGREPP
jgi:hypothetical protein